MPRIRNSSAVNSYPAFRVKDVMTTLLLLASISIFRMGGDIDVADAPNGAALRTMGGDIHITRAAGKVIAKTMGGNIEIRSIDGSATASTMGGDIRVTVNGRGAGHDLDLRSEERR